MAWASRNQDSEGLAEARSLSPPSDLRGTMENLTTRVADWPSILKSFINDYAKHQLTSNPDGQLLVQGSPLAISAFGGPIQTQSTAFGSISISGDSSLDHSSQETLISLGRAVVQSKSIASIAGVANNFVQAALGLTALVLVS